MYDKKTEKTNPNTHYMCSSGFRAILDTKYPEYEESRKR